MRIKPMPPGTLSDEARAIHDEITRLIGSSQQQVSMTDSEGALVGPFPPMLKYPQFGAHALSFSRSLDMHGKLDKCLREIVILTVGGVFGARFILYAHETMAKVFGIATDIIASLAAAIHPQQLDEQERIVHSIAFSLVTGKVVPAALYKHAVSVFGEDTVAEIFFLTSGYTMLAVILNGFDIPALVNE